VTALRDAGSLPQIELARVTGLSAATVSNLVRELTGEGRLTVSTMVHNGRQARRVQIAADSGVIVGVDLAHRHLRVAVAAPNYDVLAEDFTALTGLRTLDADLERAQALLDALLTQARRRPDEVLGIGVGVPAPVDPRTGDVRPDGTLPGWLDADRAAQRIAGRLGPAARLANDATLGLLAETIWGAAHGYRDAAYVHIATGIGAGLMSDGHILHGATGMAGELGHNTVDENGPMCRCGNRGCVDVYASTPALLQLLRGTHGPEVELPDLLRLVADSDHAALRVVEDAGRYIGPAVASLCNLLNPRVVLIGGDLAPASELLLAPVRDAVRRHAMPGAGDAVEILPGTLGERATVLGAIVQAARSDNAHGTPPAGFVADDPSETQRRALAR